MTTKTARWTAAARRSAGPAAALLLLAPLALAQPGRDTLVLAGTNESANSVAIFKLDTAGAPSLSLVSILPTGGAGGSAGGGAGALQFSRGIGAVANYGSNTVTQLLRFGNSIWPAEPPILRPAACSPSPWLSPPAIS
jgi:hypothetical protein